jgi:hypothetical protein
MHSVRRRDVSDGDVQIGSVAAALAEAEGYARRPRRHRQPRPPRPCATGDTPIGRRNFLTRAFLPTLRRAKIDNFRWHDLRDSFASRPVMAGVELRTVLELMATRRWR